MKNVTTKVTLGSGYAKLEVTIDNQIFYQEKYPNGYLSDWHFMKDLCYGSNFLPKDRLLLAAMHIAGLDYRRLDTPEAVLFAEAVVKG